MMGKKRWVAGMAVGIAILAASGYGLEKDPMPKTSASFSSPLSFDVYAVMTWNREFDFLGRMHFLGRTPKDNPIQIPTCDFWFVKLPEVGKADMARVREEIRAKGIPGLCLPEATDAELVHLEGLTGLHILNLGGTQVTDAGIRKLQEAIPGLAVRNEKVILPKAPGREGRF